MCELDGPTPILKRSKTLVTKAKTPAQPDGPRRAAWQADGRSGPFVLLDDARPGGGRARLYRGPAGIIETREPGEVRACLGRLRGCRRHAAGFLSYEAGHALEPKLAPLCRRPGADEPPLLWFGLFEGFEEVEAEALAADPAGAWAGRPRPLIDRAGYEARVGRAKAHIEAGDI